jgi:hypothetical protein
MSEMSAVPMGERVAVLETKIDGLASKIDRVLAHQEEAITENAEIISILAEMDRRLKAVEPIAQDVSKWRERAIGARMAAVALWLVLGGAVASIVSWGMKVIGFLPR